ncbi:MAG: Ig-like domain-containing protein [Rhodanobacteraceae bacterium]
MALPAERAVLLACIGLAAATGAHAANGDWTVVGWNNLGMQCMGSDYSVMSILPPSNTIEAQVMDPTGHLMTPASGVNVTFEAVADPTGSINSTSIGKTDFWSYAQSLFGLVDPLPPDTGLTGISMPGITNAPQPLTFDATTGAWTGEGIPATPYDDAGHKNTYPLFRVTAHDANGAVLAISDVVLPVSDEITCKTCHASNSAPAAEPAEGWVNDPDPERDYRLNAILRHDDRESGNPDYAGELVAAGYDPAGLYATVTQLGKPVLCGVCHASNALGTIGVPGVAQLTTSMHRLHANVIDPATGMSLDNENNRSACYTCHAGPTTKFLRGIMGNAVATDGTLQMQCQSCHGGMSRVGAQGRTGWLDEPTCQNCHTGTALNNNGEIRYTNVYDTNGERRVAVDTTFATTPDVPEQGFSLYRFSASHGGLQCEACHGSTHAEFPSSHVNDNLQSIALQGHAGTLVECATCHGTTPNTVAGGPHGMHPVGQSWVSRHGDAAEGNGRLACRACHGSDYRGTVLSYSQADRTLNTGFGSRTFWAGFQIGCYACHNGPNSDDGNSNHAAVVNDVMVASNGTPVSMALVATDVDGDPLTLRIVSQPAHGTVGLSGTTATYYPDAGFDGADTFTFAAWDGETNSNLGTGTINVVVPDEIFGNGFEVP